MRARQRLSKKAITIAGIFTSYIRVMVAWQFAKAFFADDLAAATRELSNLRANTLLEATRLSGAPITFFNEDPEWRWEPGQPQPTFSDKLAHRWPPPRTITVWHATTKAKRIFGGTLGGKLTTKERLQISHDALLANPFLLNWLRDPEETLRSWVHESHYREEHRGQKLPDAKWQVDGCTVRLIESGGAYTKGRLLAFHRNSELLGLPYEIW